ncbi:MAG: IS66 family insertion sequence element accessory protein TnpB [Bacteroidetes bacterium]|nr:IS66 family insertion sequence element accessory protein TnpB [Bacteroidota bacterium]
MKKLSNLEQQEKMFSLIKSCKESGMTNKDFCQQNNIGQAMFYYWQKKMQESKQALPTGFIPVKVKNESSFTNPIEILYPNGVKLRLAQGTDLSVVRVLIGLG